MQRTSENMSSLSPETNQPQNPTAQNQYAGDHSIARLADNYPPGFRRKVLAELIGTYLLVFVASGTAALSSVDDKKVSQLGAELAAGFIVMVMVYATGHISGAHINPAVSIAFAAAGHFPWKQVPFYLGAQTTGGIAASFTLRLLLHPIKKLGTNSPSGTDAQALVIEILITFILMLVICAVTTDSKAVGDLAGVAIGFSVAIGNILGGPISGGSMNPARTLGPAIASGSYKGIWVYLVGPTVGAVLGAWSYSAIKDNDNKSASLINLTSFISKLRSMNNKEANEQDDPEREQPDVPRTHKQPFLLAFAKLAQNYPPGFLRKVLAEIIGTYLLVFVGSGSAALNAYDEQKISKLGVSLAGGFTVIVMIYAIGHISGAHINPAVSLAFAAVKHFPWKQVPLYVAAQLIGAISASFTLRLILDPIKQLGTTSPSGSDAQALVMEIVATFTLMFIAAAVSTDAKAVGELAGVAVGSSVFIAGILAGPISGGSMNPARTLGPAIASGSYKGLWVYLVGPVTGALLGAWSYTTIKETDKSAPATSLISVSFELCSKNRETEHVKSKDSQQIMSENNV